MMGEAWLNAISQVVATVLASAFSAWLALFIFRKEKAENDRIREETKIANTSNALSFVEFACSTLHYFFMMEKMSVEEVEKEIGKLTVVNGMLKEIKSVDIVTEYIEDYQNCKILLLIIEIEIHAEMRRSEVVEFSKIDLERRLKTIDAWVKTNKNRFTSVVL